MKVGAVLAIDAIVEVDPMLGSVEEQLLDLENEISEVLIKKGHVLEVNETASVYTGDVLEQGDESGIQTVTKEAYDNILKEQMLDNYNRFDEFLNNSRNRLADRLSLGYEVED